MWEWITNELYRCCKALGVSKSCGVEVDDVVQDVCLYLLQNQRYAKEIYNGKKRGLLVTLLKSKIYETESKIYFDNKMDFMRYQRVIAVCDKYGIEPIPENAYKIAAVSDDSNMTIVTISSLLTRKKSRILLVDDYF